MNDILIFLIAIVIHELGHYLSFRSFKYTPSIKLSWYGAILIGENCYYKLTPLKAYFVNVSGVLWGAVVLAYFNASMLVWMIYILASGIDILNVISLFNIKKEWRDKALLDIAELQLIELREKFPK